MSDFTIFIVGHIVVGGMLILEHAESPPLWVHAIIWPLFTIPAAILMMRPLKAALVAQQYRYRSSQSQDE